MNLSFFIARKLYINEKGTKRASLPAIRIATFGVAVGIAVMILAVTIVLGFKNEISSKVTGFGSHITIYNSDFSESVEGNPIKTNKGLIEKIENVNEVKYVQRFSIKSGILKTDDQFSGISLKGLGEDYNTEFIKNHIVEGKLPNYHSTESTNDIVISKSVANDLKIGVGDKLFAYFFDGGLRVRRFKVSAIYSTDLTQFDEILAFASDKTVRSLCRWNEYEASGLEICLKDFSNLYDSSYLISKLVSNYNLDNETSYVSYNIKELYPQIFDWLNLLDINIWVILILMLAVAGVTIVSGLLILILERTSTIALLKTLGATNALIRKIFIKLAVFILLKGMILGNILGMSLALMQKYFHLVHLDPESYYIDSVPIKFSIAAILLINVVTFFVSTLTLVVPSYMVARIHPSRVLRFE